MNGASGKYDGATVNVAGMICARVVSVAGTVVVVRMMPGKILPTGEPMPGKKPAAPKLPPPPVAGPSVALNGTAARSKPKPAAVPPVNGNGTKNGPPGKRAMVVGKLKPVTALFGVMTTMPPLRSWFGLKVTTPDGLIVGTDKNNCEFGR